TGELIAYVGAEVVLGTERRLLAAGRGRWGGPAPAGAVARAAPAAFACDRVPLAHRRDPGLGAAHRLRARPPERGRGTDPAARRTPARLSSTTFWKPARQ